MRSLQSLSFIYIFHIIEVAMCDEHEYIIIKAHDDFSQKGKRKDTASTL
jgi:hypothetical protein